MVDMVLGIVACSSLTLVGCVADAETWPRAEERTEFQDFAMLDVWMLGIICYQLILMHPLDHRMDLQTNDPKWEEMRKNLLPPGWTWSHISPPIFEPGADVTEENVKAWCDLIIMMCDVPKQCFSADCNVDTIPG